MWCAEKFRDDDSGSYFSCGHDIAGTTNNVRNQKEWKFDDKVKELTADANVFRLSNKRANIFPFLTGHPQH